MSLLSVKNLSAGYGKTPVLKDISFEIAQGELVGILGANGSGKSTLINAICKLQSSGGTVLLAGASLNERKAYDLAKDISYVPQKSGIEIDISVLDVVLMGFHSRLKLFAAPTEAMREEARAALEEVGLLQKADCNYRLLSEGQKQLVILARAYVGQGRLLIMDEPERALDITVRNRMMQLTRRRIQQREGAGLVALHDISLALNACDRLLLLKDGYIVQIIDLHSDTFEQMEEKLSVLFGAVRLQKVDGKNGKAHLVMVCDSEDV